MTARRRAALSAAARNCGPGCGKGWRGPKKDEVGTAEGVLVATVDLLKPGVEFRFTLLDRGHRDVYRIVVPVTGEPTIEPAAGEFSERG